MSLAGLFDWFSNEIKIALFIVLFIVLIVTAFKRAWIAMIGSIVGLAFIGMFIVEPELLTNVSEWLTDKLAVGRG